MQEVAGGGGSAAVINSRLCSLPCSGSLSGQRDWPSANLANGLGLDAWLHSEQQFGGQQSFQVSAKGGLCLESEDNSS